MKALAALLFLTPALAQAKDPALQRILRNLAKVQSYEGTLIETGVVPDADVKTDVVFMRPNRFAARIAEPPYWAGSTVTYDGDTLVFFYPRMSYAIRFRSLELPAGEAAERLVEYQYHLDLKSFSYRIFGSSKVAGLPAVTLWHEAKGDRTFNRKGWTKVYDKYSMAVAGEMKLRGDLTYGYRFENLELNRAVQPEMFTARFPEGTVVAEWDLAAPPVEEGVMKKEVTFPIAFPRDHLGLVRKKIVRVKGPVPAFTARYERGHHLLLVVAHASGGLSVPEYGLPVGEGRLVLNPILSSYTFAAGGTYYTLLGNLPYEELLHVAASMTANDHL